MFCITFCITFRNAYFTSPKQYYCNTGGDILGFQLRQNKKETENKTIRFPLHLVEQIENAIKGKNVSFSSFVIQACEYALRDMDKDK